jgi:hypothetical protein
MLDIATNWLKNCIENHGLCKIDNDKTLPTRLISIANDVIRLVITKDWITMPRYSTLSHAWGQMEFPRLTCENYRSYLNALPVEELPRTFKDAIDISRKLGIEYLWIDSLCIIQNNNADWEKEVALMSSVYGCSTINIAASSATDGRQGCFLMPLFYSGGFSVSTTFHHLPAIRSFQVFDASEKYIESSYLTTRAWTHQERILAPRTIHFGKHGAIWECCTKIASEFLPEGFADRSGSIVCRRTKPLKSYWNIITESYSKAKLTLGKDKLPALSGIARRVYNEGPDEYLAGMWRNNIVEQLCWGVVAPAKERPAYRAPTWSWCSVDSQVEYPDYTGNDHPDSPFNDTFAHVLDAKVELSGQDPFGQVKHGVVRIACSVMVASHRLEPNHPRHGEFTISVTGYENQKFLVNNDCIDDGRDLNETVYLLPLLGTFQFIYNWNPYEQIAIVELRGILLRPTGVTKGEYQRLGSFCFGGVKPKTSFSDSSEKGVYYGFKKILEQSGEETAEAACAEIITNTQYPKEQYVITII